MERQSNFLIDLSVLYRNMQKYFDRVLAPYEIGSGQVMFLYYIYEHEGCTMQDVTRIGEVDKGTTTKSVQRLIEQGYVQSRTDEKDRRVKRLYSTDKAADIMRYVYDFRNSWKTSLMEGIDQDAFEAMLDKACENSRQMSSEPEDLDSLRIGGVTRFSLIDYPGKAACTVFTAGCNLKCPYCHNKELVFLPEDFEFTDPKSVLDLLDRRKGVIDAVCVTGGEPLIQKGIGAFLREVREKGYLIKLDTNGCFPEVLKELVEEGLVDYVAMDIKNSPEKYAQTCGTSADFNADRIRRSAEYLMEGHVDYEFRTTVVRELHTAEDLVIIAEFLKNAKRWYLQQFSDDGNLIQEGLSAYTKAEMEELCGMLKNHMENVQLRGIKDEQ